MSGEDCATLLSPSALPPQKKTKKKKDGKQRSRNPELVTNQFTFASSSDFTPKFIDEQSILKDDERRHSVKNRYACIHRVLEKNGRESSIDHM